MSELRRRDAKDSAARIPSVVPLLLNHRPHLGRRSPFLYRFFEGFAAAATLASLLKGQQPARSPVPPPSSFPSGFKPVVVSGTNNRLGLPNTQAQQRGRSRTDLDFEGALASSDTILLKETIDLFSSGLDTSISLTPSPRRPSLYGSPPGASGKYEGLNGSPSSNPKGRNTATPLRQPGTPNVIQATPTPPRYDPLSVLALPTISSSNSTPFHTPLTTPNLSRDGEDGVQPSPLEGIRLPPCDAEENEYKTRRQSMYRSPGSASSPDLVTLLKKTKQRSGSSNQGSSGTGNRDTLRVDAPEGGSGGGNGSESSRRLRTTSATPSSTSSNSVQQQGQRSRVDRSATTNSSSSSFQRGEDSSKFLSARSPDWVLPNPSASPTPSPSAFKVCFPLSFTKSESSYLTFA